MGNNLKFQNPRKAKKERIDTLFKKACVLSRVFVHNPPKNGRIGLLVEYEGSWKIFLSEENQEWPIDFKVYCTHPFDRNLTEKCRSSKGRRSAT
jgi:hypothetical protein